MYLGKEENRRDWYIEKGRWVENYPNGSCNHFTTVGWNKTIPGDKDPSGETIYGVELKRNPDNGDHFFIPRNGS